MRRRSPAAASTPSVGPGQPCSPATTLPVLPRPHPPVRPRRPQLSGRERPRTNFEGRHGGFPSSQMSPPPAHPLTRFPTTPVDGVYIVGPQLCGAASLQPAKAGQGGPHASAAAARRQRSQGEAGMAHAAHRLGKVCPQVFSRTLYECHTFGWLVSLAQQRPTPDPEAAPAKE